MSESLIHARGLTKTYGDFVAVDGIDFDVAKGESFGFLGPNGAGKSTTMRIIGATSVRTSGTLTILGKDPEVNGPQIRAHLGVVPQQDNLDLELTVSKIYLYMVATLVFLLVLLIKRSQIFSNLPSWKRRKIQKFKHLAAA